LYLHALFVKEPHMGAEFHELQVSLYAEYDRKALLPFLRGSNEYRLEEALKVCEINNLYSEMVFILGRMGNTKQALSLVIEKIGDVKEAIKFIETHNDDELWEDLIEYSMKNPKFVSGLLENIGGHVDPIKLISKIPNGMQIIGLRDRLVKIISDYNLQMSLREGCNLILKADCVDLAERQVRSQKRAFRVEDEVHCASCSGNITMSKASGVAAFWCSHVYHVKCLKLGTAPATPGSTMPSAAPVVPPSEDKLYCILCNSDYAQGKKKKASIVQ